MKAEAGWEMVAAWGFLQVQWGTQSNRKRAARITKKEKGSPARKPSDGKTRLASGKKKGNEISGGGPAHGKSRSRIGGGAEYVRKGVILPDGTGGSAAN